MSKRRNFDGQWGNLAKEFEGKDKPIAKQLGLWALEFQALLDDPVFEEAAANRIVRARLRQCDVIVPLLRHHGSRDGTGRKA